MLLVLDIGNSNFVVGLFETTHLQRCWRLATRSDSTVDELRFALAAMLAEVQGASIDAVAGSCVVPNLRPRVDAVVEALFGYPPFWIGPGSKTGLRIRYEQPKEAGSDLIADAVAAVARYGAPAVVVDFGTATAFVAVDRNATYLGSVLAPGVETAAEGLFAKAAKLPKVEVAVPSSVIGHHTVAALQSGLSYGAAALADGVIERIWAEMGEVTPVIATGGLAHIIAPLCRHLSHIDEGLTLSGIAYIYERSIKRQMETTEGPHG